MDRTLAVRQADPADRDAIRAFVVGLSARAQYLRFFACVAPPSTALLRALCGTVGRADILLVTDAEGVIVAHGMAADDPVGGDRDNRQSSIGLVVADEWQRLGIGTVLLDTLAGRAANRGVHSLVLDVLPSNRVMIGIIRRRWPDAPAVRTADAIVFRPAIGLALTDQPIPGVLRLGSRTGQDARGRSAA